jgi:hypothetical protein
VYPYRNQKSEQGLVHEKEWTGDTISNICKRYDVSGKTHYKQKAKENEPKIVGSNSVPK